MLLSLLSWLLCVLSASCIILSWPRHWLQLATRPVSRPQQISLRTAGSLFALLALSTNARNDIGSFALWSWVLQMSVVLIGSGLLLAWVFPAPRRTPVQAATTAKLKRF